MKKFFLSLLVLSSSLLVCPQKGHAQFTVLDNFNDTNGKTPLGSLTLAGNKLYGMTPLGGVTHDSGVIFSIDTNGTVYTVLWNFNGTTGAVPYGSLSFAGSKLYGMASEGGVYNKGVIFSMDTNGTGYTVLWNFNDTTGANPTGSLLVIGNKLYGMTTYGNTNGTGVIFSIDTNGAGYTDLWNFNVLTGAQPEGALSVIGDKLYGMTSQSGANGDGVIFSIDTIGAGYTVLWNFNGTDGEYPDGSLLGIGNKLYGMTIYGGVTHDSGVIFSIDTNGAGYTVLWNFNGITGAYPNGSLSVAGSKLYGTASTGSANTDGVIFSIDTNGTAYKDLLNFNFVDGAQPDGSLSVIGGQLYGTTSRGGAYFYYGVIFELDTAGVNSVNNLAAKTNNIILYPNPNNGLFQLQITPACLCNSGRNYQLRNKGILEIYNMLGQKIYSKQFNIQNPTFKIDLSGQPEGVFLYRVITVTGNFIGRGKFIIQ